MICCYLMYGDWVEVRLQHLRSACQSGARGILRAGTLLIGIAGLQRWVLVGN